MRLYLNLIATPAIALRTSADVADEPTIYFLPKADGSERFVRPERHAVMPYATGYTYDELYTTFLGDIPSYEQTRQHAESLIITHLCENPAREYLCKDHIDTTLTEANRVSLATTVSTKRARANSYVLAVTQGRGPYTLTMFTMVDEALATTLLYGKVEKQPVTLSTVNHLMKTLGHQMDETKATHVRTAMARML